MKLFCLNRRLSAYFIWNKMPLVNFNIENGNPDDCMHTNSTSIALYCHTSVRKKNSISFLHIAYSFYSSSDWSEKKSTITDFNKGETNPNEPRWVLKLKMYKINNTSIRTNKYTNTHYKAHWARGRARNIPKRIGKWQCTFYISLVIFDT